MGWLISNIDVIVGLLGASYGAVQKVKAKKAQAAAKRLATELDEIRTKAGTKATWE